MAGKPRKEGAQWHDKIAFNDDSFEPNRLESTSKRKRGFPSETNVKRGDRGVETEAGFKEFCEKLGRNDPCPCGSGLRFQEVLHDIGSVLMA